MTDLDFRDELCDVADFLAFKSYWFTTESNRFYGHRDWAESVLRAYVSEREYQDNAQGDAFYLLWKFDTWRVSRVRAGGAT